MVDQRFEIELVAGDDSAWAAGFEPAALKANDWSGPVGRGVSSLDSARVTAWCP